MKYKKLFLSIGILSIAAVPLTSASCSRYSVDKYSQIVSELKKYAVNTKYLIDVTLPNQIKIKDETQQLKMKYKYFYLAGSIEWTTKIGSREYNGLISGWKQYPKVNLNPVVNSLLINTAFPWSNGDYDPLINTNIASQLQLSLNDNSYVVQHNINITKLGSQDSKITKVDISKIFTGIFIGMCRVEGNLVNKWVTVNPKNTDISQTQKDSIDSGRISAGIPENPEINSWFTTTNINDVFGYLSFNPGEYQTKINTNYINYSILTKQDTLSKKQDYLKAWANGSKNQFNNIFKNWKSKFEFSDLIQSIDNIIIQS